MKMALLSNGHGEDSIALNLLQSLEKQHPCCEWVVFPLVGQGHAYTSHDLTPALTNPPFPSGGFIRSLKDALNDIRAGLLSHVLRQRKTIRNTLKNVDGVIAVGDIFCLWMAAQSKKPLYFLPTAKSESFMPHSFLEIKLMKRWCKAVYTRDSQTAEALKKRGVPASYKGNVMMDNLLTSDPIPGLEVTNKPLIGILPGSREEAYDNLAAICDVVDHLGPHYTYVIARASSMDEDKIKTRLAGRSIHLTTHFKAVINRADLLIGLSGTGNEQAAYLGKPVICFEGKGPQTSKKRFLEQQKLMGKNIVFSEKSDPKTIAALILETLDKKASPIPSEASAGDFIAKEIISTL